MTIWDRWTRKQGWKKDTSSGASSDDYVRGRDTLSDTWCSRRNEMVIVDVYNQNDKLIDTTSECGNPQLSKGILSSVGRRLKNGRKRFILINPK